MIDLVKFDTGKMIDLADLPPSLQKRIRQYAIIEILTDEAKEDIKANRIDIGQYLSLWLKNKSARTRQTYQKAIDDFFYWLSINGITHPLLVRAEHVDRYIEDLKGYLKPNSIRLKICAVSSFYSTMKRYGHITLNPFRHSMLPKKEYKKAIKTDQAKTIPVMTEPEYDAILRAIKRETKRRGKHISNANAREAAKRLLPAVKVMAEYGLRVGAIPTIEVRDGYFTYTTKGNKSFKQKMKPGFPSDRKPFKGYKVITIQKGFKRTTERLKDGGIIQHAYSCHDLRHRFAFKYYSETHDIVGLKALLGHASINVTDVYLQSIGISEMD